MTKWLILAVLVLGGVAIAGWQGYALGVKVTNGAWFEKVAIDNKAHAEKINELQNLARSREAVINEKVTDISLGLAKVNYDIKAKTSDIDRIANNVAKLRWNFEDWRGSRSPGGQVAVNTRECDGEEIAEFSPVVYWAVYDKFGEADEIVNQLSACQEILSEYQKACNAPNAPALQ